MIKKGELSIWAIALIAIGAIILLTVMWGIGKYNGFVKLDKEVDNKWANVQTAYQRRADLIPNFVEIVKGAANFEKSTLTEITGLRSQAGQAKIDIGNAKSIEQIEAAGASMSSALSRLLVIVENYPELKATQNFLAFQDELAGTENRIKWERDQYNEVVKSYQVGVSTIPGVFIARIGGFSSDKHKMFQAETGAEKAPKVTFE